MEKLSINACPVCGSTHLKRVMTCTDFYASGEQFELYSCEDCGFTFTQGVPVEAEIGKYYETPDYISHTDTRKGAMNNIYHYVRSYMLGRKARLVAKEAHRKTGRLLDIGTYAANHFPDSIPEEVKQARLDELMALQEEIALESNASKVGQIFDVIVDREEEDYYVGRTEYDSPEVDPEVLIAKDRFLTVGDFCRVKVVEALPFELMAVPVELD